MARKPGASNYTRYKVLDLDYTITNEALEELLNEEAKERYELHQIITIPASGLKLILSKRWY